MAESKQMKADRKAALINELEWSRIELGQNVRAVYEDLDVAARFRQSVVHQKTVWLGGAALAGWVLSRFSWRKKQPEPAALPSEHDGLDWKQKGGRAGILLALLNALFTLFKPAITTFATRKINQLASQSDLGSSRAERRFH